MTEVLVLHLYIDDFMISYAPLRCISRYLCYCRIVKPARLMSELDISSGLGLKVGLSHPKAMPKLSFII